MTTLLLAFALVLMAAVLLSGLAHRTVLSTAVMFLAAGFVLGDGVTGLVSLPPAGNAVGTLAELALFSVLFTDGMKVGWRDLRSAWKLPGRALALGLPLTLLATAVLAHWLTGLGWTESLLLGAVLSPTDPVFASALVGNDKVPGRLRHLLNVESGVNDGLALPFVIVLLAMADEGEGLHLGKLGAEIVLGLVIGVVVPVVALWLERRRWFAASGRYEPLNAVAIGLVVLALAQSTHANLYLAAFTAGITVATYGQRQRESFEEFGELVAELLKLAALLVFGTLITPDFLGQISFGGWVFAVASLVVARPLALWIAFLGSKLGMREQAAAMWFGPKGFASVVYGLLVLNTDIPAGNEVFHLVALTIVLSIVAHSSTDIVVARWFDEEREVPAWYERSRGRLRRTASRSRGRG
ncbi:MAG: cation:proton antiporter [Nocardioides sp.]